MAKSWQNLTAAELGREIGAGRINPVDLAELHLDAINSHPHADRIYARLTAARARAEAMAAHDRARRGFRRGLLDGVPISWKDLFDTAGVATESGSALLKGRVPVRDAEVLEVAMQSGLVCLGKTHMSELAFSGLGLNPVTATPPCINDENAVPGGSSSGAAASVAYGLAPAAIGSLGGYDAPLAVGSQAHLTLVDPSTVSRSPRGSLSSNNPYPESVLPGRVMFTFHHGVATVAEGELVEADVVSAGRHT
jgi:aspartyl-tRNA(Asn)/glutamyl-tRNA(Gln) amidotransferase subunit A